jgi:DHA2 family multidrug resistance protein
MATDAALPALAALSARRSSLNKWLVTISVLLGAMMGAIDSSVVNVALAHIQASYGVTTQEVTWVTTSYLIALVIVMPLTAWLASVLGRRRMFLTAIAIFTGSSLLCGVSRTLGQLITFRVLQGLGGGVLQPSAQAIMRETFPPEEQAQAQGIFGMILLLGPAIGPTLGGWLTDNYSWPWIFFVNLPIGIAALFMASQFIVDPPYMRARGFRRIDGVGIGLMALGLSALQVVLEEGETDGWFQSSFIVGVLIVCILALAAFVVWELRAEEPAVDLRIFGNLSFASGACIGGVMGLAMFGGLILLPLFFQTLLGYDATQAGLTLMPRSAVMVFMMPVAGMFYNRLGPYVMLPFGLTMAGVSGLMMTRFTLYSSQFQLVLPLLVQGTGFAFMFVALSTTTLSTIPRRLMQNAAGMFTLMFQLGGSLGTALIITILDHKIQTASTNLAKYASIYNPSFTQWWQTYEAWFVSRGSDPATAHRQALFVLQQTINQQSAVVAFEYAFGVIAAVFFLCLPLLLLLRRGRVQADEPAGIA